MVSGHSGSVACGYGISLPSLENVEEEDLFVVTTGDDFCIKGWKISINDGSIEESFTYKLPGRALVLDILIIPSDECRKDQHWPLIVYGGDDGNTYIMSSADGKEYNLTFKLSGHQDWITSLSFCIEGNSLWLLSCAKTEDRSIVVWEAQEDSSSINKEKIWVEKTRLGEVGGNREGFFNCKFGPAGDKIVAVSYQGGLHLWHNENGSWVPQPVVSGHFDEVADISWDRTG
ncbi:hypothetical protein Anas_12745, partial [Armadillidium nasatum]